MAASLAGILYQDVSSRMVSGWLYLITALSFGLLHYIASGYMNFLINIGLNFMLLILIGLCCWVILSLRKPRLTMKESIGLGDIFFFIGLALGFATYTFVVFLSFGILFSLIIHFLLSRKRQDEIRTVPLAGYLSLFYLVVMFAHWSGLFPEMYFV